MRWKSFHKKDCWLLHWLISFIKCLMSIMYQSKSSWTSFYQGSSQKSRESSDKTWCIEERNLALLIGPMYQEILMGWLRNRYPILPTLKWSDWGWRLQVNKAQSTYQVKISAKKVIRTKGILNLLNNWTKFQKELSWLQASKILNINKNKKSKSTQKHQAQVSHLVLFQI